MKDGVEVLSARSGCRLPDLAAAISELPRTATPAPPDARGEPRLTALPTPAK
jgi:hypothetical protein